MKAWRVHNWCGTREMKLESVSEPEPGPGEALVKVHTAALNFFDNLMIGGKYQVKPPLPFTPGCEIAGEVVAAGPGSNFKPGNIVVSQPEWGAFAEYCLVGNNATHHVPEEIPIGLAAAVPVVYPTAHVALQRRGQLLEGDFVLVSAGAGGVGLAAIQLARAWGGRPMALAGSAEKRRICIDNGAEIALDYRDDRWIDAVRDHTGGRGFDLMFDPVGGETFNQALKVIAFEGRAVIIGFAGGAIQQVAANRLLLKNASAVGAIWGRYLTEEPAFAHEVVADCFNLMETGQIEPVVWRTFAFDEVPIALQALDARETYGKVLISVGGN
jgi:NADPH:quinone reductase